MLSRRWFLTFFVAVSGLVRLIAAQDDLDRALPRLEATEPGDALGTFRLLPGFRLLPVAAEPIVEDPIVAAFDEDGGLFVVEMGDYPFEENRPDGRIRELIDADGDGRYESSRIFLDGLAWPTGLAPYRGGWFVITAPDLIYARDTDGDGRADERRVVFTGFGTQNVQALANNLLWGPDGWIHGASGGNGGSIRRPGEDGGSGALELRGGVDFRFDPRSEAIEATTGGGQFGQTFDDWGHRFVCSNSNHAQQVVWSRRVIDRNSAADLGQATINIAADGAAAPVFRISEPEPWRVVRTRQRAADPAMVQRLSTTELSATGFFTSATGITVYRGSALGPDVAGNLFVGDVGGNLVHRKRLVAGGPNYVAERADPGMEFLSSSDNWFRPANLANTPSGTLLVIDMYREAIEHPASIPDDIKRRLDLRSGRDRGRIYEVVPERFERRPPPRLSGADTATLVRHLEDRDGWWRDTARRLLIEGGQTEEAAPLLRGLLSSPEGEARTKAEALFALSALSLLEAADLVDALDQSEPRLRELAARLAGGFAESSPQLLDSLTSLAQDADPMVRAAAAVSVGEVPGEAGLNGLLAFTTKDDLWMSEAVASGLAGRAFAFAERMDGESRFDQPGGERWVETLGELIGAEGKASEMSAFLALTGSRGGGDGRVARRALLALGAGRRRVGGSLDELIEGSLGEEFAPMMVQSAVVAADEGRATEERVAAIQFLALGSGGEWIEVFAGRLRPSEPPAVQLAAVRALGRLDDPALADRLLEVWDGLALGARREAVEFLMRRPESAVRLLDAIESGEASAGDLDRVRRAQLLASPDGGVRERAAAVLVRGDDDRSAVVARYRAEMPESASVERGRALAAQHCATCHEPRGGLAALAPDLRSVAGRSAEDLLMHILDPNREVGPGLAVYAVATRDGRSFTGILVRETDSVVVLRRAEGEIDEVSRGEIEAIRSTGLSLMPEGLEKELDPQALADVIAYLRQR